MGVIPLEYLPGDTADSLGLTGRERYTVIIPEQLTPRMIVDVKVCQALAEEGHRFHSWGKVTLDVVSVCPHSSTQGRHFRSGWDLTPTWSWRISTTEASSTTWSARCPKTNMPSAAREESATCRLHSNSQPQSDMVSLWWIHATFGRRTSYKSGSSHCPFLVQRASYSGNAATSFPCRADLGSI